MKPKRDIYFQKAIQDGYLARSAYKLLQIDELFNIFEGVTKAIDLCSAPGSWTQVIYNKLHNVFNNYDASKRKPDVKIVSVDMMPMDHFPGITYFEKDISQYATMKLILEQFSDEKADIIVCDGSIDVVGMKMIDYYMHNRIFLSALYITLNALKTGGNFVMKIFIGKGHENIIGKLKLFFRNVSIVKPDCSRNKEAFAVCQSYIPLDEFDPVELTPFVNLQNGDFSKLTGIHRKLIPYLCCDCYRDDIQVILGENINKNLRIEKNFFNKLNTIIKDAGTDAEILKKRALEHLPVYQITEDSRLVYHAETFKAYFNGLEVGNKTIGDDNDDIEEESEINHKLQSVKIDDDNPEVVDVSDEKTQKRRAKINEVLGEKIEMLRLQNVGKHCGLGFNLNDWKYFSEGDDKSYLKSIEDEGLKSVYGAFHEMYEEIDSSRGLKCKSIRESLRKQEEIKTKVRNYKDSILTN